MKPSKRERRKKKRANSAPPPPSVGGGGDPPPDDGGSPHHEQEEYEQEGGGSGGGGEDEEDEETGYLKWLVDAFSSASLEKVKSAYREARGDPNRAAEILVGLGDSPRTSGRRKAVGAGRKQKKVVASTGMVSDMIGKSYGRSSSVGGGRGSGAAGERKGRGKESSNRVEVEEFLFSMLGESCELDAGVVRDVLGNCEHDVEKALDVLLDMSASSNKQAMNFKCDDNDVITFNILDMAKERSITDHTTSFIKKCKLDKTSSVYHPSENDQHLIESGCRERNHALGSSREPSLSLPGTDKQELQHKVLQSLFKIPDDSKHDPHCMNWKKIAKRLEAFGPGLEVSLTPDVTRPAEKALKAKEDSYQACRGVARQHWETMRSYYQRAAAAYSKGERAHATYLSEEGKRFNKLAREADEKASLEIFEARNKDIQNTITIDLHGQHVQQAMAWMKLHLLFCAYSPSIRLLRVITGCGSHGVGMGKLKQSVIKFVEKEGVPWREENSGTLLVNVDGFRQYSFVTSDSESD